MNPTDQEILTRDNPKAMIELDREDFRVEVVTQIPENDSKVERGQLFYKTLVLRNSGARNWPADFKIFPLQEIGRSNYGEVKVGENIGITLFGVAPRHFGPFNITIVLTSSNEASFKLQFWYTITVTKEDDSRLSDP